MTRRTRITPADKVRALELEAEVGAVQAARRLNAADGGNRWHAGTIRAWRSKVNAGALTLDPEATEELAAPAPPPSLLDELEREQREALEDLRRARREGVKNLVGFATTHAIAVDKLAQEQARQRGRPTITGDLQGQIARVRAMRDDLARRAPATTTAPEPLPPAPVAPVAPVAPANPVEPEVPDPAPQREVVPDPEPEALPEPAPVEDDNVEAEPELEAEIVPIRRRRGWSGLTVQRQFLAAHAEAGVPVDPSDFKPPQQGA